MIAYFDTSALMKLFLLEPGTDTVRELWDGASARATSVATYPEARSALASAVRSGRMESQHDEAAVTELDLRYAAMNLIVLDPILAVAAGVVAQRHALRGYDAVHLASALSLGADAAIMITWDADLARAAGDGGLAVVSG